jgi:hypothetical protein
MMQKLNFNTWQRRLFTLVPDNFIKGVGCQAAAAAAAAYGGFRADGGEQG